MEARCDHRTGTAVAILGGATAGAATPLVAADWLCETRMALLAERGHRSR